MSSGDPGWGARQRRARRNGAADRRWGRV